MWALILFGVVIAWAIAADYGSRRQTDISFDAYVECGDCDQRYWFDDTCDQPPDYCCACGAEYCDTMLNSLLVVPHRR